METNLQIPLIHLNGTSKDALLDGYRAASDAIRVAIDALAKTAPNGRDYYLHADKAALALATKEHCNRIGDLQKVGEELMSIYAAIITNTERK